MIAFALAVTVMVIPVAPALANHGSTTVDVGIANDGDVGRDNYDDSNLVGADGVLPGTQIDFFFDNGPHNVIWVSTNPAALPDSNGTFQANPVGTTFSVNMPAATGNYLYFCGIHSSEAEALAAGDFGAGRPGGMYGRIAVLADTTAPVWGAGSAAATPISASQIDLTWPTATDDSGSTFFDVYQASGASDPGKGAATLVGDNVSGTTYSASGLTAGVHYWYWITPVDGAGNEGSDLTTDATTSSVAASATAQHVVQFSVDPTLSLTVSPSILDVGTLSPASAGLGSATVTVQSNDTWSMSVKSIGRDGIDDAAGDDAVFTADSGATIPVDRATWNAGGGANVLSAAGDVAVTGQAATASTAMNIDYVVQLLFDDVAASNYQTTVLYTVTQP